MKSAIAGGLTFLLFVSHAVALQSPETCMQAQPATARNIVLFIADGLRHDSVTAEWAPTMFHLREQGVDFTSSHSLYPTFTTPNASAFATGHLLGDTGDFGNTLYVGYPLSRDGTGGTLTPFIENDVLLARLNDLYHGNYLGQPTLASIARENGYSVFIIGKLGPAAIQDISEVKLVNNIFQMPEAMVMDDATGTEDPTGPLGLPILPNIRKEMLNSGLNLVAPDRSNGQSASSKRSQLRPEGTLAANYVQQQYLADIATQAALTTAKGEAKPFLLIYWSRDPDGSQHNQGDGVDHLFPGINGPTSHAGVRNADNNLAQILDFLRFKGLDGNTDVFVVADHGFSTISKRNIALNHYTSSYAAGFNYANVPAHYLPPGFLAIDLAHVLKLPLYDPDARPLALENGSFYHSVVVCDCDDSKSRQYPGSGNGIIGGTGKVPASKETDAQIIVAANGGSDLIYLPQNSTEKNKALAQNIAEFLLQQDYTDGVFVNDDLGNIPGTLPTSAIGLQGATELPQPALIVNFKSFSTDGSLLNRIEVADSTLREGQGMHGSFSRADTFNTMIAFGPDFKKGKDPAPAGNADIAVTISALLKWRFPEGKGSSVGRVLTEAFNGCPDASPATVQQKRSQAGPGGATTVLNYQTFGKSTYYDQGCLVKEQGQNCK